MTASDTLPAVPGVLWSLGDWTGDGGLRLTRYLVAAYLALLLIGYCTLRSSATMVQGQELAYDRATFTAVNAATLTGFPETIGVHEFNAASARGPATIPRRSRGRRNQRRVMAASQAGVGWRGG